MKVGAASAKPRARASVSVMAFPLGGTEGPCMHPVLRRWIFKRPERHFLRWAALGARVCGGA